MSIDTRLPFVVLSFAIIGIWMSVPFLEIYSLQLVALTFLLFVFLRFKHNRNNLQSPFPNHTNSELIPITLLFMLLISATGNTHSWAYPLTYLYLFLIVFSLEKTSALLIAGCTFALQLLLITTFTVQEMIILVNIPLITGVMLYAKDRHTTALLEKQIIEEEEALVAASQAEITTLEDYIQQFLLPKTATLSSLGTPQTELEKTLHSQITLIVSESEKLLKKVNE